METAFPDDPTEKEFILGITEGERDLSLLTYIILHAKFYFHEVSIFVWETRTYSDFY